MIRVLQGVQAQYTAFRAIQTDGADDVIGRLAGAMTVFFQLAPIAVTSLKAEPRSTLFTTMLVLLVAVFISFDLRRGKLTTEFWGEGWKPSTVQKFALSLWLLGTFLAVAFTARVNVALALAVFVVLGSLPLKPWVDRLARHPGD